MALLSTEKWLGWSWRNAPWITEQNRQKAGGLRANKGVMNILKLLCIFLTACHAAPVNTISTEH